MFNDCIIMAGGSGTRLWPASRAALPKQFLKIPAKKTGGRGERSFFGAALERALAVTSGTGDGQVIIIAGKNHLAPIVEECAALPPPERKRLVLIPEPLARNTAPAIASSLLFIDWTTGGRDRNVLVLSSDHIIGPLGVFKTDASAALAMAQADKLAVFGIAPEGPETGYGYIEAREALTVYPDEGARKNRRYEPEVFRVASFREKPDLKKARHFVASGRFYWNSGMFAFSSKFMMNEFRRSAPKVFGPFRELWAPGEHSYQTKKGLRILNAWDGLETAYRKTEAISFDYAIAEKCRETVMVKAGFSWNDVGSWDEYARLMKNSGGEVYAAGGSAESCFVDADLPVALCAVEDLIVVVRSLSGGVPPAVLIAKKGETQRVRELVEALKKAGRTDLV
jgi:mannose-1-phosphate guanylyltransferase/mannose-1-phosphate guanylyltransferase/mannose-6-phosphate isomerase